MAINILVVDSSEQFGTLVQQSLEAEGEFEVTVATSASDAMHLATLSEFRLAIVDLELPRNTGLDLLRIWSNQKPELALVAVPLAGNQKMLQHLDVPIHGVLFKPFYLPDLPAIIQSALASTPVMHGIERGAEAQRAAESTQPAPSELAPPGEEADTTSATDFDSILTVMKQVTDGKQVLAVIITKNGQPWTDNGVLNPEQKHSVFSAVNQVVQSGQFQTEVVRYIDLLDFDEAPLHYLVPLEGGRELSVLLSPFISINTARQIARRIIDAIHPKPGVEAAKEDRPQGAPAVSGTGEAPAFEAGLPPQAQPAPSTPLPADWVPQVPPTREPEIAAEGEAIVTRPSQPAPAEPESPQLESTQVVDLPADWIPEPETRAKFSAGDPTSIEAKPRGDLELQLTAVGPQIQLPYSLVLIPRFPEHRLVGVLSEKIRTWALRLCIAWDWRMVDVSVHPDHLRLTLQLSPEIPPATVVSTMQAELSGKILGTYPDLLTDLPSKRFWASSFLLLAGPPPSQGQIQGFIAETRKAQGL